MRRALLGLVAFVAFVAVSAGQEQPTFRAVDVYVDAGARALGAYQVEIDSKALVVGIEGGAAAAFAAPPHYDPAALRGGRVILGAFTLRKDAPKGRVRVARVHFQETGAPQYEVRAVAAAALGGERIAIEVELVPLGDRK